MHDAVELTSFYLRKGLTMSDFIAANGDIDPWLQRQRGFILRRIWQEPDGRIHDFLLWRSVGDAQGAAARLVTELASSPVHDVIDHRSVRWNVWPCQHSLSP